MPKNKVSDLTTDQEIAFARLVLSGTMTDRDAAQTAGLDPDSAAYTKAKPHVRAYMLEHHAAVEQQTEGVPRLSLGREQVLGRLWEIANMPPEMTRDSITGQVKALSMIVAIQGFIPDRLARPSSPQRAAPPPNPPKIYPAAWLAGQQAKTNAPQPDPAAAPQEANSGLDEPEPGLGSAADAPLPPAPGTVFDPTELTFANRVSPSETTPSAPYAPAFASAPSTRVPFSTRVNPFTRRR